jgi:hypothetical protein
MYCLNCGWCCEHMSPLTNDENVPCPHLINRDGMVKMGDDCQEYRPAKLYEHGRPKGDIRARGGA